MRAVVIGLTAAALCWSSCVNAEETAKPTFEHYVAALKQEAVDKGFSGELVEQAFAGVSYRKKVVKADKNQPRTRMTLDKYLATRVPDWKVKQAVERYQQHQSLLEQIADEYGVQARFIVALWGNESNFGKIQGKYPVMSSLTTMAYDGRREAMFRKQIFATLQILQEGHISQDKLLGSWAGAMGQSQFMPTSFLSYAVDHDGDGKKDIWNNTADVFASIANFLRAEGWKNEITWGRQVTVSGEFDDSMSGLSRTKMKSLADWQRIGVRRYDGTDLPSNPINASVIMPDGISGRIYLVYENFHTLMKWNRSSYFGVSVGYLSDRIKRGF